MFMIMSDYPNLIPEKVVLGDVEKNRFIRAFKREKAEIIFGKLKRFFPYKNKFSTDNAEIISPEKAIYKFGEKIYQFFNDSFREINVKVIEKKELITPNKCKYKMYLATFYDRLTQIVTTKYLVVPT